MEVYPYAGIYRTIVNSEASRISDEKRRSRLRFCPALYEQRFTAVYNCINCVAHEVDARNVTEFGFGTARLLHNGFQFTSWCEKVNLVDIDGEVVRRSFSGMCARWNYSGRNRLRPLTAFYYQGNMAHIDHRVSNAEIVVAIEVIEHMTEKDFEEFPKNVFGYMQPKCVIFTTPNRDFNELMELDENQFRHPDHKFEFSRYEFREWAEKIVDRYPLYNFRIYGIGPPAEEDALLDLGFASQMVVFRRISDVIDIPKTLIESHLYVGKFIFSEGDNRTPEQKKFDKVLQNVVSILCDLELTHKEVYMPHENCTENAWVDVVPVKMLQKYFQYRNICVDLETLVRALVESYISVENTIAFGQVCTRSHYCNPIYFWSESDINNSADINVYELPDCSCASIVDSQISGTPSDTELCSIVEQHLNYLYESNICFRMTREACRKEHVFFFTTAEAIAAHLKTKKIEIDSDKLLNLWRKLGTNKYPIENVSFGFAILISCDCEGHPCELDDEDSS